MRKQFSRHNNEGAVGIADGKHCDPCRHLLREGCCGQAGSGMGRGRSFDKFLAVKESKIARRRAIERRDIHDAARMRWLRRQRRPSQGNDLIERETPGMS